MPLRQNHLQEHSMSHASTTSLAAAAAIFAISAVSISAPVQAAGAAADAKTVHCFGINSCKGTSDCKSGNHECKGQNSCKGQGFKAVSMASCTAQGGSTTPPAN
jgi:uncharacterized membrane protein